MSATNPPSVHRSEFAVHILNDTGKRKAEEIARTFEAALNDLEILAAGDPRIGGREMAIVRTKLEEGCFFAKKAMAIQPANQQAPA